MRESNVPNLFAWVLVFLFTRCCSELIHRVEVEVRRIIVHPLQLLLSRHLEPLLHVDAQEFALFFQRHLRPLLRVLAFRARWMANLRCHFPFSTSFCARSVQKVGSATLGVNRAKEAVVVHLVVVLVTELHTLFPSFHLASLPDLRFRQCVESFQVSWWCLDNAR